MSRPDQLLLVGTVYLTGGLAGWASTGSASPAGLGWGLAALVPTAAAVHWINEFADYATDALTRRTPFSGGSGALHELGLDRSLARRAAVVAGAAGLAAGLVGTALGVLQPAALALLFVGAVGGWLYSVGPYPLSRHGWGEVANAVLGGLLLPWYGVAAATGQVAEPPVAVFAPFALLVFVNLLATQWPDRRADAATGKRTLVVRAGRRGVRAMGAAAVLAAYGLVVVLSPEQLPAAVAIASLATLPLSAWALWRLARVESPTPAVLAMLMLLIAQCAGWAAVGVLGAQ